MKNYLLLVIFFLSNGLGFAQIPAGHSFWLKSDEGITEKNDKVSQWQDITKPKLKAVQNDTLYQPQLLQNSINGLPVVRFNGTHFLEANPIFPVRKDYTLFFVVNIFNFSSANNMVSGDLHAIYYNPPRVLHGDFNTQSISEYPFTLNKPAVITVRFVQENQFAEIYMDGLLGDSAFVGTNPDSILYLGAFQKGNFLYGDIAEVILYNEALSKTVQNEIQDYLFKRYDISKPKPPVVDYTFSEIPQKYQLYPRDKNNSAEVRISGNFTEPGFDSIYTKIYRDNLLIEKIILPLNYLDNSAPFAFNTKIKAELYQYKFVVGVKNETLDSVMTVRDSIVCGDVILVNGQSNSIFGANTYTNEYIRTFGGNFSNSKKDTLWSPATAVGVGGGNNIGGWAMRLAQLIIENQQIPVCVINGGVGGTFIEQHIRTTDKYNLSTIYGSMLFRVEKSNLKDAATSMFWYQGESNTIDNYYENFKNLHNSWKEDFPNLKKIYVVQIRNGCGLIAHSELRDLQRRLGDTIKGISIETVAASGLPGHDGCHYSNDGYIALGKQLYRLYAKDFYGSKDTLSISSPNISKAFFTDNTNKVLALVFKPNNSELIIQPDTTVSGIKASLREYLYLNDSVKVKSLTATGDTLFLNLEKESNASDITYLPDQYYNGTNVIYEGPWLYNQRGVGALSFYRFPVTPKEVTSIKLPEFEINSFYIDNNPSDGNFNIIGNISNDDNLEISVTDIKGEVVFKKVINNASKGKIIIPVNLTTTGIYFCNILTDNKQINLKALVVK